MLIASRLINLNRTSPDVWYPAPNAHQVAIAMWTLPLSIVSRASRDCWSSFAVMD